MADVSERIGDIKVQLREATQEAQKLGIELSNLKNSSDSIDPGKIANLEKQFEAAVSKAATLKDEIKNTNETINVLTSGSKFEKMGNSLKDVAGKIASLDFDGASESANRLAAISKTVTFKDAVTGVKSLTSTFANLGKVLLTNPLFLLVTVVTTIIAKFDELKASGGVVGQVFSAIGDTIEFVINKLKMLSDWFGLTDFEGQKKAQNTLKNAEKEKSAVEDRYDSEIAIANAAGKETTKLELKKQEAVRQSVQLQIEQLNYLAKSQGKLTEDQQKQLDELNKSYKKSLTETAVITAAAQKEANEKAKKAAEDEFNRVRDLQLQYNKLREENFIKSSEITKRISDDIANANKKTQEGLLGNHEEEVAAIAERDQLKKELRQTDLENELDALALEYREKQALLGDDKESQLLLDEEYKQKEVELTNKAAEKEKAIELAKTNANYNLAQQQVNSLMQLSDALVETGLVNAKTGFKINKALSITQVGISTIQGVQNALSAQSTIPEPFGTILKGITAAGIAASGIANVAKISKTQFNPNSGGKAESPTTPSTGFGASSAISAAATPAFGLFGGGNQLNTGGGPRDIEGNNQTTIQVQVSETEITGKQKYLSKLSESAVL